MTMNFPDTPTVGQVFTAGDRSWEYDGEKWLSTKFSAPSTTITTNTTTTVDSWSASTYRSVKYVVQVVQGTKYTVSEVVLIHDGTTATMTEFAVIELYATTRIPITVSTVLTSGIVYLQVTITDAASTNATVKLSSQLIGV